MSLFNYLMTTCTLGSSSFTFCCTCCLPFPGHPETDKNISNKLWSKITINPPMIYTAPCIMFWMRGYPLLGQVGGCWARESKVHRWFYAQEPTREVSGPILRGVEVHYMRLRCIKWTETTDKILFFLLMYSLVGEGKQMGLIAELEFLNSPWGLGTEE